MQAVALAAREDADLLLLVGTGKIEARQIGARVDVAASHAERLHTLRYNLVHALVGAEILVVLVHVCYLDGVSNIERTLVGLFQTHDETEQSGLAGAVGTDDAHDAVAGQHEVEVGEQHLVVVSLGNAVGLDHLVAKTGTVGNVNLQFLLALLLVLVQQAIVA